MRSSHFCQYFEKTLAQIPYWTQTCGHPKVLQLVHYQRRQECFHQGEGCKEQGEESLIQRHEGFKKAT